MLRFIPIYPKRAAFLLSKECAGMPSGIDINQLFNSLADTV